MTDVIKLNWPANKIKNPVLSKMWPAEPQEPQDIGLPAKYISS